MGDSAPSQAGFYSNTSELTEDDSSEMKLKPNFQKQN